MLDFAIIQQVPTAASLMNLPVVFALDPTAGFVPVDFDTSAAGTLYLPLLTDESVFTGSPVNHLTLPFLSEYQSSGLGVRTLTIHAMLSSNLGVPGYVPQCRHGKPWCYGRSRINSGIFCSGSMTITCAEETALMQAVAEFNQIISGIAGSASIPVVDAKGKLTELNQNGIDGFSGNLLLDPQNTAFSLDGVHPNSAGYAIIANNYHIDEFTLSRHQHSL
ncbi:MAG: SGNH/GDSL hydrolase family protein [Calditrichia bacterium]